MTAKRRDGQSDDNIRTGRWFVAHLRGWRRDAHTRLGARLSVVGGVCNTKHAGNDIVRRTDDEEAWFVVKTDLTFDELCAMLKAGTSSDGEVVNLLDAMSGALMVLSPAVAGIPAASVFGLLGAKNEIFKAGRVLARKLSWANASDKLSRHDTMLAAYCLSCYTAFFEALKRTLPDIQNNLDPADRLRLSNDASVLKDLDSSQSFARHRIDLPHPNDSLEHNADQLESLYSRMSTGLDRLVRELSVWDRVDEATRDHIAAAINVLPERAKELYKGQYLALCVKFPEFSVWANQQEHDLTRRKVDKVAVDVRAVLELLASGQTGIDVGLSSLGVALSRVAEESANEVLKGLGLHYRSEIDLPVIDDSYSSSDGIDLRYPKKSEIYVPQAFRALRYFKGAQLEDEFLWEDQASRDDIGAYILSYLASPYSLDIPLVVLGQPGSGKSLLTEVLAARLASAEYQPVRVRLRDINPDSDIQDQIEEQIRIDTGRDVNWVELSSRCERPPLIILDGYDELLQATGKVFSNYLKLVGGFQRREQVQGRPVRVIVTSRVTLIDKADVPIGTTIVKLDEFDIHRQTKWTSIWNGVNHDYFHAHNIKPFIVPDDVEMHRLARQPLLLLMLALYDSDQNRLSLSPNIDQTGLYHNLLTRFITRERLKDEQFSSLPVKDREVLIRGDLKRLSVAAIGMFNRRALHIAKDDLQQDIEYFQVVQDVKSVSGVPLSQAELLLGSFFFVHESRSRMRLETGGKTGGGPATYEFLHNTFGEFLAADWILSAVLEQAGPVALMNASPGLAATLQQLLESRDGLPRAWFATLMVTPLFSRPVVVHMLRQWSTHRLHEVPKFTESFELLLYNQLKRILSAVELPGMLLSGEMPFNRAATLTNLATYTLNLVLLRCAVGGVFAIDIERLRSDVFPKPWMNLIDLWRAGLGREGLAGISVILEAHVDESGVRLSLRDNFAAPTTSYLASLYNLGVSIGDDQMAALAGWALQDAEPYVSPSLQNLRELPCISGTSFHDEISARLVRRQRAENGTHEPLPDWVDEVGKTTSALLLRASEPYGLRPARPRRSFRLEALIATNAELGEQLWQSRDFVEHINAVDPIALQNAIRHRPILIANLLEWSREARFAVWNDRDQENMIRAVNQLVEHLESLPVEQISKLPMCVRYEIIASGYAVDDEELLLGHSPDLWTISGRSRATVLRLLKVSEASGVSDWVRLMVEELSSGRGGPRLARRLGGATTLTLLRHPASWTILPDAEYIKVNEKSSYHGIVEWAVRRAVPAERLSVVEECVKLVALSPFDWLAYIQAPFNELKVKVMELASMYDGDLSQSALKALRVLRKREFDVENA